MRDDNGGLTNSIMTLEVAINCEVDPELRIQHCDELIRITNEFDFNQFDTTGRQYGSVRFHACDVKSDALQQLMDFAFDNNDLARAREINNELVATHQLWREVLEFALMRRQD